MASVDCLQSRVPAALAERPWGTLQKAQRLSDHPVSTSKCDWLTFLSLSLLLNGACDAYLTAC